MKSLLITELEKQSILQMYKDVVYDININYNLLSEAAPGVGGLFGDDAVKGVDDVIRALQKAEKNPKEDFFKVLDKGGEVIFQGNQSKIDALINKLNATKNALKTNTQNIPDLQILKTNLGDEFDMFILLLRNFKGLSGKILMDDAYEEFLKASAKISKVNEAKAEYDFLRQTYNELVSIRALKPGEVYNQSEIEAALSKVLKNPNTGTSPELFIKTILPKVELKMQSIPEVMDKAATARTRITAGTLAQNTSKVLTAGEAAILQQNWPRFWVRYIKELRRLGWGSKAWGASVDQKATQEIEKQLEDLELTIAKKIEDGQSYDDEIKKISDLVIFARRTYKTSAYDNMTDFYRKWLSENKLVTYDADVFKEFLAKNPEINFLLTTSSTDISDFAWAAFSQRVATFFNPFRGNFQDVLGQRIAGKNPDGTPLNKLDLPGMLKKAATGTGEAVGLASQRELMRITWGTRMLNSETKILVAKFGVRGYFQKRMKSLLVIHFLILPAIYSFFDSIVSILFIRKKLNEDLKKIRGYFCDPGKMIFTQEQCDRIKPIPTENINYLENFWAYFPLVGGFGRGESNSFLPITHIDNMILGVSKFLDAFKKSDFTFEMFLQTFMGVKVPIPQELRDLGYDSVYDFETNVNMMLAKMEDFPKPVADWMKKNPVWSPIPKQGVKYDENDIKYIDVVSGEEVQIKTENTYTMYNEEGIVEKVTEKVDKWSDDIEKQFIKTKFKSCLFENDLGELYDSNFGEGGFQFITGDTGDIRFNLKRKDGTIDEVYPMSEVEAGDNFFQTYRYKDDDLAFSCERAEDMVLGYTNPSTDEEITSLQAKRIGLEPEIFNRFKKAYVNSKFIYVDDGNLILKINDSKYPNDYTIEKIDDEWWWKERIDKDTKEVLHTYKKKENIFESKKQNKKMKTLNESIREKLTSKYVDKTNKYLKINENYEKVYKYFEKGDYDTYFKKMFKLAEAFKNSKLYLTEADDELFSKGISLLGGQEPMIKEKFVDFLSKDLGLTPSMRDYIESKIEETPNTQIGDLFMKPSVVIDIIVDAVVENVKSSASEPTDLMSAIELTTVPYFDSPEFRYKLSKVLKPMIGQKLENKKGKIIDMVKRALKAKEDKSES